MSKKQTARNHLKAATSRMSSVGIELLTLPELYAFVVVKGLSGTFVKNIQHGLVAEAQQRESQEIAYDIVTRMKAQFPDIAAVPERGRIIKVWLDGKPEEIEL